MKSIDYFIGKEDRNLIINDSIIEDLDEIMCKYNKYDSKIKELTEKLEKYKYQIRKDEIPTYDYYKQNSIIACKELFEYLYEVNNNILDERCYDLTDQLSLYMILNYLIDDGKKDDFIGIDISLIDVKKELLKRFKELVEYINTSDALTYFERAKNRLVNDTFFITQGDHYHDVCMRENKHLFIRTGDELKCVYCGFTTKEFESTPEKIDFLTKLANDKGQLLENVTEKDLPLIEVIKSKQDYIIEKNRPTWNPFILEEDEISEEEKEEKDNQEEYYDYLVAFAGCNMQLEIDRAHLQDAKKCEMVDENKVVTKMNEQKYLTPKIAQKLLKEVNEDLKRANELSDDDYWKPLFIEMCKIRRYEILILAGKHIPTLYHKLNDEYEKECLAKAYYNLSNQTYRELSSYFILKEPVSIFQNDGYKHKILTADPEVNQKILDMKLKRR